MVGVCLCIDGGYAEPGWGCLGCGAETKESSETWMIWVGRHETLALLYELAFEESGFFLETRKERDLDKER
jgi:hypothetical protein